MPRSPSRNATADNGWRRESLREGVNSRAIAARSSSKSIREASEEQASSKQASSRESRLRSVFFCFRTLVRLLIFVHYFKQLRLATNSNGFGCLGLVLVLVLVLVAVDRSR